MMKEASFKKGTVKRKDLKDFTRMALAFYGGLLAISCYQQVSLFSQGILDSLPGATLFLSAVHHLGFTAILALLLSFVFNALESRRPNLGAQVAKGVFVGILAVEFLLTDYFVIRYEVPVPGIPASFDMPPPYLWFRLLIGFFLLSAVFYAIYRRSGGLQLWISKMYPFTIVLFSMFLATLLSEKRPVNRNKTEKMLISWVTQSVAEKSDKAQIYMPYRIPPVSPRERVWVHSVFSGSDFDKAYQIARDLAHEGQLEHAKCLARHILWEVPGHVDAEILLGRLYAWEHEYDDSEEILVVTVGTHPLYEDAYAALLDTYYWSGQHQKALHMQPAIGQHLKGSSILEEKLQRSRDALGEDGVSARGEAAGISKIQGDNTP